MEKTEDSNFQKRLELSLQPLESRVSLLETSLVKLSIGQSQQLIANQMVQDIENRLNTLETSVERNSIDGDSSTNSKSSMEKLQVNNTLLDEFKQSNDDIAELLSVMDDSCKGNWDSDVAVRVLPIAVRCGSKGMVARLSNALEKALTVDVGVQMFQLASRLKIDSLLEASQLFIAGNFQEVSETMDFCDLTFQELNIFIFCDTLNATEQHIFKAIIRWVLKDRKNRSSMMSILITAVRLPSCSLKFLQEMQTHFLLNDQSKTQSSIAKEISTRSTVPSEISQQHDKGKWRWTKPQDTFFIMGGKGADSSFETFDESNQKWVLHKDCIHPDGTTFVVTTTQLIIVLEVENKRMRSFQPVTKEWKELQPLPVFRNGMCVSLEDTGLYVMGGDGLGNRCDVYSVLLDSWGEVTGMKTARTYASSASLKGKIYCSGGRNANASLGSVELYDSKNKLWSSAKTMITARDRHCMVPCSRFLWIIGGYNTTNGGLKDLERYDPSVDTWTKMSTMLTTRYNATACYYGGLLYVLGGGEVGSQYTSTEVYDPLENKWTKSAVLCKGRAFASCCAIPKLANAEEYKDNSF